MTKNTKLSNPDITRIINKINFLPEKRLEFFSNLSLEEQSVVLLRLTKHLQHTVLNSLPKEKLVYLFENLDPDDVTDMIQLLPKSKQSLIIAMLSDDLKKSVTILSGFDPYTAGGLMNLDYIQVLAENTIFEVAKKFKIHEQRTGRAPVIIVMGEHGPIGYLPGHELGFAKPGDKIKKYIKSITTIRDDASHVEVVSVFKDNPHSKLVVLGRFSNVVGIIYSDDVLKIIDQGDSQSLYDFAGVTKEESVSDSIGTKVKNRYKWLIINLATAFLAASTVSLFEGTISKYVLLAVYMPIVAGMGGNAATQTLAVIVRGIALRQIDFATGWHTLKKEVGAGFVNGIINGILVASVVFILNRDFKIALILSFAMVINLVVAGFFGTLVPLIMKKLGKDPATSATIFITTATDVLGFLAFLGLATLILS